MPFQKGHKLAKGGKREGSGRKKLSVRAICAKCFEDRIPILCEIADNDKEKATDRIAAVKQLASVGIADKVEVTGENGARQVIEVIYRNKPINHGNDSD